MSRYFEQSAVLNKELAQKLYAYNRNAGHRHPYFKTNMPAQAVGGKKTQHKTFLQLDFDKALDFNNANAFYTIFDTTLRARDLLDKQCHAIKPAQGEKHQESAALEDEFNKAFFDDLKGDINENDLVNAIIFEIIFPSRHPNHASTEVLKRRKENTCKRIRKKRLRIEEYLTRFEDFFERNQRKGFYQRLKKKCEAFIRKPDSFNPMEKQPLGSAKNLGIRLVSLFTDMHFRIHYLDYIWSQPFYATLADRDKLWETTKRESDLIILVTSYIFYSARTMPWLFTKNGTEHQQIIKNNRVAKASPNSTSKSIWAATLLSLLSLYARAATYAKISKNERSLNDYLKMQEYCRLCIKYYSRGSNRGGMQSKITYLTLLEALAEYRIGETYRINYAFHRAKEHLNRAYELIQDTSLRSLENNLVQHGMLIIDLMVSMGKVQYELGYFKDSLHWHFKAVEQILNPPHCTSGSAKTRTLLNKIKELDKWLDGIKHSPYLNKEELKLKIKHIHENLTKAMFPPHLRLLAADILNRIGHILLTIRLSEEEHKNDPAVKFTRVAAELDPKNILIQSNLLKMSIPGMGKKAYKIDQSFWSPGVRSFEKFARFYEYTLLHKIFDKDLSDPSTKLLRHMLAHTQSSNVKISRTNHYLTKPRSNCLSATYKSIQPHQDGKRNTRRKDNLLPILEYNCLRRYSSFFPFLPKPSAHQVLGGGYLIRLSPVSIKSRKGKKPDKTFGIAIDPGPDYIDNLYRSGFTLDDINMIIVTHDHPDHSSSIDPLLALLYYKADSGGNQFYKNGKQNMPLLIVGNESISQRYKYFNNAYHYTPRKNERNRNYTYVTSFSRWRHNDSPHEDIQTYIDDLKKNFEIHSIITTHGDIAGECSHGIKLRMLQEPCPSITITSDTHSGDVDKLYKSDRNRCFSDSDIFVAHLSLARLSELAQLSGLEREDFDDYQWMEELYGKLSCSNDQNQRLYNRIAESYWIKKDGNPEENLFNFKSFDMDSGSHLYYGGVDKLAEIYKETRTESDPTHKGLFIISEHREELGSFRPKIATAINDNYFKDTPMKAITADIGLKVIVKVSQEDTSQKKIAVLCALCEKENDYAHLEKFHIPKEIEEICIKGEDEGIFYFCKHHNPRALAEPLFFERIERYDIFGRVTR